MQRPVACDLAAPLLSPLTSSGRRLSGFAKAKRRPIWRGPTMWESPLSIGWRHQALSQTASQQANKAQAVVSTKGREMRTVAWQNGCPRVRCHPAKIWPVEVSEEAERLP